MSKHKDPKKRKRIHGTDTSKPTAVFKPARGRSSTLSIALPGSIIANAQTHDLKTLLCGEIARAAAVFCVDEIVVFDDGQIPRPQQSSQAKRDEETGYTAFSDPNTFLCHVLSYLETPPHLRRHLFPQHPDLRTAGALPSLDMPHHLRSHEWCRWREGVTLDTSQEYPDGSQPNEASKKKRKKDRHESMTQSAVSTTTVEAGLSEPVKVFASIPASTRVTLDFGDSQPDEPSFTADAVPPSDPRETGGYYWGYTTRLASSLSAVFTECPWALDTESEEEDEAEGYDVTIGFSERGVPLSSVLPSSSAPDIPDTLDSRLVPRTSKHAMLVFGGVSGLEPAVEADSELQAKGLGKQNAKELFDFWVNLCPGQGSRTIRTEEAIWMGLMATRDWVANNDR